jgi:hypothetical protein
MFKTRPQVPTFAVVLLLGACHDDDDAATPGAGSGGSIDIPQDASSSGLRPEPGPPDASDSDAFDSTGGDTDGGGGTSPDFTTGLPAPVADDSTDSGDSPDASSTGASPPAPPTEPVACGGQIYACGDMVDNDGDGKYDLDDPECVSPCDDDEGSFQTGIPGDNVDCHQDCFFDGNSGHGDDGCNWNLHCDATDAGAAIGCEYTASPACPPEGTGQPQACLDACEPLVPAGCDCFGCCTVGLADGSAIDIFLNSGPDCALDNLGACAQCTSQIEACGNPCDAAGCELCFGEDDVAPGCAGNVCDAGAQVCEISSDCLNGFFCLQGCCVPRPAG